MSDNKKIYVTQPSLPPLEEFIEYLKQIWQSKILTNSGPFHRQFEKELADYLGVKYISLFANGTLALVTALKVLKITGEVITTPFSFVATTNSLWWNNIKPVFVDIEPDYFTLDTGKIEAAITPQTKAILPVHIYGNPCRIDEIQKIADKYELKIIYDAAHAFGVHFNGISLLNYGDLSTLSFHATKSYTTMEGGAIVCHEEQTKQKIDFLKNFGFAGETNVVLPGINSKMNEMQAALGILQLKYHRKNIEKRRNIAEIYKNDLSQIEGVDCLRVDDCISNYNFSYFPIFVDEKQYGKSRDELYYHLRNNNIFCRRYFYPLISDFPTYRNLPSANNENLPIAKKISEKVICLPIYPDLDLLSINRILNLIKG
ncbi:MAG: DegT/DnrJ/EryC1/StrS family aminotransferase [Clostridiaceae bacterium]|nr:DegT/DnrJ/EryC1/StrS family aminotransferase [Clostridiaceae bacterium]